MLHACVDAADAAGNFRQKEEGAKRKAAILCAKTLLAGSLFFSKSCRLFFTHSSPTDLTCTTTTAAQKPNASMHGAARDRCRCH